LINRDRERARHDEEIVAATVLVQLLQEEEESKPRRGSVIGRQVVDRDRLGGHSRLMVDYFVPNPVYDEDFFRRRCVAILLGCTYCLGNVVLIIILYVPIFSGSK
jgi:hypothetical protein